METEWSMGLVGALCLSAACGFRVFIPLLGLSIAHVFGHLRLAPGLEWIDAWPVLVALGTAAAIEALAYYFRRAERLLDRLAWLAAIVAGTLAMASQLGDSALPARWALGLFAGGGAAGLVQTAVVVLRTRMTLRHPGLGKAAVATLGLLGSLWGTVFALMGFQWSAAC
jgi:hypothetical protein